MSRFKDLDIDFLLGGEAASDECAHDAFVTGFIKHLEERVRYEFYWERASELGVTVSQLLNGHVIKWDGGVYNDNRRFESLWPTLLRFLVEIEAMPRDFIAAQFGDESRSCRSNQQELVSDDALRRYRRYMDTRPERPLDWWIVHACDTIHGQALCYMSTGLDGKKAWSVALGMGSKDVSQPLVKYALGRAAELPKTMAYHRNGAIETVVFRRAFLLDHFPYLIDESLLADVDRIRHAIVGGEKVQDDG